MIISGTLGSDVSMLPPKVLIKAYTLEDRFMEVYGDGVLEFSQFLPANQQPWTRYMGAQGDNVFRPNMN